MKQIDSVKTIRKIRDAIYERTKDKSDDEMIEYYQGKLGKVKSVREKKTEYQG